MIIVRDATLEDRDALVRLGGQFLHESPYPVRPDEDGRIAAVVDDVLAHGAVVVLSDMGLVRGFLALVIGGSRLTGRPTAFEVAWYVDPLARGDRQAVRRMLQRAAVIAKERGAEVLQVGAPNGSVAKFLERCGFHPAEVEYAMELA